MARSSTIPVPDGGWAVDTRGYVHGGFDTPIFGKVKHAHNVRLTNQRNKIKRSGRYGREKEKN